MLNSTYKERENGVRMETGTLARVAQWLNVIPCTKT